MKCLHDRTEEQIRESLRPIRCFLLDMDGTFYLGDRLIEGSLDFLAAVKRTGRRYLFLTNNSSRSVEHYVLKLRRLGVPAEPEDILTSGQAAAQYVNREYPGKRVFLLGNPSLWEEMQRHGVPLDEERPELVLVGFDTTLTYDKMCRVCDLVRAGLPYIATHPDFNCPTETGFVPDIGAIMAFIEASCGRRADVVIGKPEGEIVRAAQARTGLGRESLAMVGDRLYTDVATGVNHGLRSVLVLSGESGLADIDRYGIEPDLIFSKLGDMIPYL
jgi:HAD superfamily hydrolase (TIGR01450 family)